MVWVFTRRLMSIPTQFYLQPSFSVHSRYLKRLTHYIISSMYICLFKDNRLLTNITTLPLLHLKMKNSLIATNIQCSDFHACLQNDFFILVCWIDFQTMFTHSLGSHKKKLFSYVLAPLGLSCGMWVASCGM